MKAEENVRANQPALRTLITASEIETRVAGMGRQIDADYQSAGTLWMVGMLKGAAFFLADLARTIHRDVAIDFMRIRSYGSGTESSGELVVTKEIEADIQDKDVLIVEDIVDSGRTASCLMELLGRRGPRSLRIATLLDKPSRRVMPVEIAYTGFQIPDHFVVGYGLDHAERYRNRRDICVLEEASLR